MRAREGRNKNLHVSILKSHQKCFKHFYHVFEINETPNGKKRVRGVKCKVVRGMLKFPAYGVCKLMRGRNARNCPRKKNILNNGQ